MSAEVIRMSERSPGYRMEDQAALCSWLRDWLDGFESGEFGSIKSFVLVVESGEGNLGVISQSLQKMDKARLVGMLNIAAHQKTDGGADIMEFRE